MKTLVDNIFCATVDTKLFYMQYYNFRADKLFVVPYAHNYATVPVEINDKRQEALASGAKMKLLIANNFDQRKGYRIVYDAFSHLKKAGILNQFEINIAGIGEELEIYQGKISELSDKIKFLGWIEVEQYRQLMRETDIYLHASLREPFGIPPVDALNLGKLLIVSDTVHSCCGIIENGKNGFTYPATDASALANALVQALNLGKDVYQLGANGPKLIEQYFRPDMVVSAVIGTLNYRQ